MGISMKTTSGKLLASAALVATAAAVAGMGTYGTFTSSTGADTAVNAGSVNVTLTGTGSDSNLTLPATNILPGDTIQRLATLSNDGVSDLASVSLATSTSSPSLLTSDGTNGLQLLVEDCTVAWVGTPSAGYTCSGTKTTVVASSPIINANRDLGALASKTASATDHLKVTATLPTTAGNTFQSLSSTVTFTFSAVQRAATNK